MKRLICIVAFIAGVLGAAYLGSLSNALGAEDSLPVPISNEQALRDQSAATINPDASNLEAHGYGYGAHSHFGEVPHDYPRWSQAEKTGWALGTLAGLIIIILLLIL